MSEALRLANALEGLQGRKSSKSACDDPGVAVCMPDGRGSATLPLWVAQKIAALDA